MNKEELVRKIKAEWIRLSPLDKKTVSIFYRFEPERVQNYRKEQLVEILQAIEII